jgi:hypothetical protein
MKKLLTLLLSACALLTAGAHDHIETIRDPGNLSRLALVGNATQIATYFPLGEVPSTAVPNFPGGTFACELSFSAFDTVSPPPLGANVRIDVISITGPAGASFSFWEDGTAAPTWTKPTGWVAAGADQATLFASEDGTGYGHIHGRLFTANRPGTYQVTFRSVDTLGHYTTSLPKVITFTVLPTPLLSVIKEGASIKLSFTGRPNLVYDVQSSTTLQANDWTTIGDPLDGTGAILEFTDAISGRPRVFYRLVEYQ